MSWLKLKKKSVAAGRQLRWTAVAGKLEQEAGEAHQELKPETRGPEEDREVIVELTAGSGKYLQSVGQGMKQPLLRGGEGGSRNLLKQRQSSPMVFPSPTPRSGLQA